MDSETLRPKFRDVDIELVLNQVATEATVEANGAWSNGTVPDEESLRVIQAVRRLRRAVKRSRAGKRSYETARKRGILPPRLVRIEGFRYLNGKVVVGNEDGSPIYCFER